MNDLKNILGKLEACKVLGRIDRKTISILSPQGDEVQVSYNVKTDYSNLRTDDLTFQAVLTVGQEGRCMFTYGAEDKGQNKAIMSWVHEQAQRIEKAENDERWEVGESIKEWLK